ncbi:MAG: sulfur carrier protein ThiS [Hyphomicrobiaceae bacterium]|nr:sulfur carrier protein ThiS [Hyphomicrobiaceae bacterium]
MDHGLAPMQESVADRLSVHVNGEAMLTGATTLEALVASLGHEARSVATAVNGDFVARGARAQRRLAKGDAIEIVAPRQGG